MCFRMTYSRWVAWAKRPLADSSMDGRTMTFRCNGNYTGKTRLTSVRSPSTIKTGQQLELDHEQRGEA